MRRIVSGSLCAVAAATLLLVYHHAEQSTHTAQKRGGASAARSASAGVGAAHVPHSNLANSPQQTVPEDEDLTELAAEAERLSAMARYPASSQPLNLIGDPIEAAEHDAPLTEVSGPQGEAPTLTVFAEHSGFDAPEPMVIRAYLSAANRSVPATLAATVLDAAARPITELQFSVEDYPDRSGVLQHRYSAAFTPAAADAPSTGYQIQVHARTADGQQREAQLTLQYNQPYARLTGQFRDRFEGGNLIIEAQLQVDKSATFRVDGSLYTQSNQQPLAWAAASATLQAGVHWLELTYNGLLLHDLGVDGPYVLRFAQLNTQTADGASNSRALENSYVTQAYDVDSFNGEPTNDPEKLAEAAGLRERFNRMKPAH